MNIRNMETIRREFLHSYNNGDTVEDKSGCRVIELLGTSFLANEETLFGLPNYKYIDHEISWYYSKSRSVHDIEGITPKIWLEVADSFGLINSNYGWCIFSNKRDDPVFHNFAQYHNVVKTLKRDPSSRQAVMIYTRPSMHYDATEDGRSDFICTNTVQYLLREGKLNAIVNMRSNDVVFGYRNDFAWQFAILQSLVDDINAESSNTRISFGDIIWQTGSLHMYERDFWMLDCYNEFGENMSRKDYQNLVEDLEIHK